MTDYTIMQLVNWLEGAACKCFYSFQSSGLKPRFMTPHRKEVREMYEQDSKDIVALCQQLYKMQLPYKTAI